VVGVSCKLYAGNAMNAVTETELSCSFNWNDTNTRTRCRSELAGVQYGMTGDGTTGKMTESTTDDCMTLT